MKILVIASLVVLAGCASSSGVLQSGADTFTVTATASPGAGGEAAAKKSAYSDATQACSSKGKSMSIITEKVSGPTWTNGMHSIDITFRCS